MNFKFLENPFTGIRAYADGLTVWIGASKGYKDSQNSYAAFRGWCMEILSPKLLTQNIILLWIYEEKGTNI